MGVVFGEMNKEAVMKKIALSVAALALTAGSAIAADLPSRKGPPMLPPPPPPPLWTGFYVGANAGGTFGGSNSFSTVSYGIAPNPIPALSLLSAEAAASATSVYGGGNNGGFIGGGQVGYNWQFYNSFVVGVEADIQGVASNTGSINSFGVVPSSFVPGVDTFTTFGNFSSRLDYLGTVRGRLGWLFTPTLMVYGTGGLAYGGVTVNTSLLTTHSAGVPIIGGPFASVATSAFADTRVGWTAGGGVEWMFWPNWSAKVEYLYYDLGSITTTGLGVEPGVAGVGSLWSYTTQTQKRFDGNLVRAGLNYHFNWGAPAPVVAKY